MTRSGAYSAVTGGSRYEQAALGRVMALVAVPDPGGRECRVLEWISHRLLEAGVSKSILIFDSANRRSSYLSGEGDSGNLICKLPGTRRDTRRTALQWNPRTFHNASRPES